MISKNFRFRVVLLLLSFSLYLNADTHSLTFDDDGFVDTTKDRHYTGGLFYTWMSDNNDTLYTPSFMEGLKTNNAISLTSLIFTPENKRSETPVYDDIPYAGYAKLNFLLYKSSDDYFHEFGINIGIVGPSAKAKQLQSGFHSLLGRHKPDGWDTQLKDQVTAGLSYNFAKKYFKKDMKYFKLDWTNNIRGDVGNFYSGALVASCVRIGSKYYDTFPTTGNFIGGYESSLLLYYRGRGYLQHLL